jgi:cyclase
MTRFSRLASASLRVFAPAVFAAFPATLHAQVYVPGAGPSQYVPTSADSAITVQKLAPGVYAAKVQYVWTGWVELPEGILLVNSSLDDQTAATLADSIRSRSGPKPVKYVVNTQPHQDDFGGNRYFVAQGATVYAHARSAARIDSAVALLPDSGQARIGTATPKLIKPTVRIERRKNFGTPARPVEVLWLGKPANTWGDLIVYLPKQKILFAGDLVSSKSVPWLLDPGMNRGGWMAALDSLQTKAFTIEKLIPGHGEYLSEPVREIAYTWHYLQDSYDTAYKNASYGMQIDAVKYWGGLGSCEGDEFYQEVHFLNMRRLYNQIMGRKTPGRPWMRALRK